MYLYHRDSNKVLVGVLELCSLKRLFPNFARWRAEETSAVQVFGLRTWGYIAVSKASFRV